MKKPAVVFSMTLLMTFFWVAAFASAAIARDLSFGFNLVGPNTTQAPSGSFAGDTITLTGAGSFDTTAQTVVGSGTFEINAADGSVVEAGTWKATAFVSFCSRGGPSAGFQGGVLTITVTLSPVGKPPMPGLTMTLTCLIFGPPNNAATCSPGPEGVTVDVFTDVKRGATLFHLNQ